MKPIILLDDELPVLKLLRRMLRDYNVLEASSAQKAQGLFQDQSGEISLLIADLNLPEGSGARVALALRSECPSLPVILTSGYPVDGWGREELADLQRLGPATVIVLQKPFQSEALLEAVRELTEPPKTLQAGG